MNYYTDILKTDLWTDEYRERYFHFETMSALKSKIEENESWISYHESRNNIPMVVIHKERIKLIQQAIEKIQVKRFS